MKSLFTFLNNKGQLGALILAVLCIIIVMGSIFAGLGSANYEVGTDLVQILKDKESTQTFEFFNAAIIIPVILIGLAAFAMLSFGVKDVVSDPKGSIKLLAGVGVLVILFFIFQSMSDAHVTGKAAELVAKDNLADGTVKRIGGGIMTTVLLIGLAIAAAVVGGIANLFK
ncbi:MAG: hypothetical protein HKO66_05990 [Saprospiraceae bacterium]|nr:hypothetical protein [Bacteroidia bacterium]NNE15123.1 hypothetical protein [Saprospiraceae bacterium]NNL91761.1 hypothetical protein [Saprospiraceae bacterium]